MTPNQTFQATSVYSKGGEALVYFLRRHGTSFEARLRGGNFNQRLVGKRKERIEYSQAYQEIVMYPFADLLLDNYVTLLYKSDR